MKVLFVGNSHTFFNDMPALFARFAEMTTGEKTEAVMLAYGGRDYKWHRKEYFAVRYNLLYGGYDYCVLQQVAHPYPASEETLQYGKELIDICHRTGTTPVIFETWAEKRFPENQQKMIDTCRKLAQDNDPVLAPVGEIWQKVCKRYPDIELYFRDGEHAGLYGDFLVAAVMCRTMTGKISGDVSGIGIDFMGEIRPDFDMPSMIEDRDRLFISLDREKTDRILDTIREAF
ncbi:MAG: hypothetical protein IKI62_03140 [Clostridia bacterium]|nr:hypothetical protein [Clostridia bacterium]